MTAYDIICAQLESMLEDLRADNARSPGDSYVQTRVETVDDAIEVIRRVQKQQESAPPGAEKRALLGRVSEYIDERLAHAERLGDDQFVRGEAFGANAIYELITKGINQ